MASDRLVTSRDILRALLRVRREGTRQMMADLEKREADLSEYVLEELTALHAKLSEAGVPPRETRRLYRRIEIGALVLVAAIQNAHLRLWQQDAGDTRLAAIDLTLTTDPEPTSSHTTTH